MPAPELLRAPGPVRPRPGGGSGALGAVPGGARRRREGVTRNQARWFLPVAPRAAICIPDETCSKSEGRLALAFFFIVPPLDSTSRALAGALFGQPRPGAPHGSTSGELRADSGLTSLWVQGGGPRPQRKGRAEASRGRSAPGKASCSAPAPRRQRPAAARPPRAFRRPAPPPRSACRAPEPLVPVTGPRGRPGLAACPRGPHGLRGRRAEAAAAGPGRCLPVPGPRPAAAALTPPVPGMEGEGWGPPSPADGACTTFSMKTRFGLTARLEPAAAEEGTVLRGFQPLRGSPDGRAEEPREGSGGDGSEKPGVPAGPMAGSRPEPPPEAPELGQRSPRRLGSAQSSPAESDGDDKDAILVQGTLVHTTSDTESDCEGKDLDSDGTHDSECGLHNAALSAGASDGNSGTQEESEDSEGCNHSDDTADRDETELHPPISKWLPKELDGFLEHDSNGKARMLMDEHLSRLLARGECPPELPDEEQRPSADNTSLHKAVLAEKTFQLPAFFSGLRVRKKGLGTEDGETVTEIKPRENDLALLKLRQPVKKSSITSGLTTKKKSAEPKASPTFLEQLSHLLKIDVSKNDDRTEDSGEGFGETEDSDEAQENKDPGKIEPQFPSEDIKPNPALDVVKALFTRPPKKETTADPSELEALKRKMRNEKESLKAVFERSKSRPGDGPSDKSVG